MFKKNSKRPAKLIISFQMKREKRITISSDMLLLREVVEAVMALVDLIRHPSQIFSKTFLVILAEMVPQEGQAIEEMTLDMM